MKAGADVFARNSEKKTAKDLADMATEVETVQFLAKCETGLIPDTAPKKKVNNIYSFLKKKYLITILGTSSH